jgi:hypothetical protein
MGIINKLVNKILDTEIPFTSKSSIQNMEIQKAQNINPSGMGDELWNKIPSDVKQLLWFTGDKPKQSNHTGLMTIEFSFDGNNFHTKYNDHVHNDPSTIYFMLPIKIPSDILLVDKLGYMPSYIGLNPEQRYVYLTWLQDISKDIDVGYKFLFYYGLERRLLINMNFDESFDMVIRLRKTTNNGSFCSYSENALLYSILFKKREDLLDKLSFFYDDDIWYEKQILLKSFTQEPIFPEDTIKILKSMDVNKRYLQKEQIVYADQMSKLLNEKYGHGYILIDDIINEKLIEKEIVMYANFSLPIHLRKNKIPQIDISQFYKEIILLHEQCHEMVKNKLAENRKKK